MLSLKYFRLVETWQPVIYDLEKYVRTFPYFPQSFIIVGSS